MRANEPPANPTRAPARASPNEPHQTSPPPMRPTGCLLRARSAERARLLPPRRPCEHLARQRRALGQNLRAAAEAPFLDVAAGGQQPASGQRPARASGGECERGQLVRARQRRRASLGGQRWRIRLPIPMILPAGQGRLYCTGGCAPSSSPRRPDVVRHHHQPDLASDPCHQLRGHARRSPGSVVHKGQPTTSLVCARAAQPRAVLR